MGGMAVCRPAADVVLDRSAIPRGILGVPVLMLGIGVFALGALILKLIGLPIIRQRPEGGPESSLPQS